MFIEFNYIPGTYGLLSCIVIHLNSTSLHGGTTVAGTKRRQGGRYQQPRDTILSELQVGLSSHLLILRSSHTPAP